jgi:hypothetical protein
METISIVLFAVAALFGVTLATIHLRGKELPMAVAVLHGLFAGAGLVVLLFSIANAASAGTGGIALGLFLVAALGGFVLFSFHLRRRALPTPLVAIHGLAAVVAFVLLLMWVL